MQISKSLKHPDYSGTEFQIELANREPTFGINFDVLLKHPKYGYVIIELLLCEESQLSVNPWTSHPSKYWNKNWRKFVKLWEVTQALHGTLLLVNYAKRGTKHEDKVKLIRVFEMDEKGIKRQREVIYTRETFGKWYRNFNKQCGGIT